MGTEEFIAKGNIERFRQKLKTARDDAERRVLKDLLTVERQRLEAASRTEG